MHRRISAVREPILLVQIAVLCVDYIQNTRVARSYRANKVPPIADYDEMAALAQNGRLFITVLLFHLYFPFLLKPIELNIYSSSHF